MFWRRRPAISQMKPPKKKESEKCMASRSQVFEFHFGVKVVEGKRLNVRVVRGNDIQLFIVILVFVEKIDKTAKE